MKTDGLIEALVADRGSRLPRLKRLVIASLGAGALLSLGLFAVALGVRADIGPALESWRFWLKLGLVALALVLAAALCLASARPVASRRPLHFLLPLAGAAGLAVALELATVPRESWSARWLGSNALVCLMAVPMLSAAPLVLLLAGLRSGAPSSPTLAGAAAGLLAAAAGALLYAFHCFDDSPLFVVTWYSLGALPAIAAGSILGQRILRW